jgi:hypothetical protein
MRLFDRFRQALCLGTAGLALATVSPVTGEPSRTGTPYVNARFGFTLSLPGDTFLPQQVRDREEGALWESRDGEARLLAVAGRNETGDSLAAYRKFVMDVTYKGATFDYTPMRENWFVLSGTLGERTFYERITFACEGRYIYGWQLTYPVALKQNYDRAVEAIHRSYRPGRGEDGRCGRSR